MTSDLVLGLPPKPGGPSEIRFVLEGTAEESEKQIAGASPPPDEKAGSTVRGTSPTAKSSTPTVRK